MREVREALAAVDLNHPPGSGYLEAGGGFSSRAGAFAWGEAGVNLGRGVRVVARGKADSWEQSLTAGVRWDF